MAFFLYRFCVHVLVISAFLHCNELPFGWYSYNGWMLTINTLAVLLELNVLLCY